jgi:aerobic carbon-monoxide dehydrogenase medium subunit
MFANTTGAITRAGDSIAMKAPPFGYVRATTLMQAFALRNAAGSEAKLLAGGQSLLASLAFRLCEPTTLIDISRVPELTGISATAGAVRVGALTTHTQLGADHLVAEHVPLLAEAVPLIAHPAVRNRGTIGGSLAFADPAAELPACCVALQATIVARSAAGERRIPARQFFTGLYGTALREDELIAAVEFASVKPGERSVILEITRRSGDYAMAGIVARAKLVAGALVDAHLVLFGVGDIPVSAEHAIAAVSGRSVNEEAIAAAQLALDLDLNPPADQHGGPEMKRHLARVLLARALRRLTATAQAHAA